MTNNKAPGGARVVTLRGADLIREPMLNKGSAFSRAERRDFGLEGLLPHGVSSMDLQARRMTRAMREKDTPLEIYVGLAALQDRNEHLYYRVLCDNLEEFMPIVYTPTVGLATKRFSEVFRRGRGIWITPDMRGRIADVLRVGARGRDVKLMVVTDNESILGIGDQGAGGMAISIGKLALYCAGAGIRPSATLPISLDVGTNNHVLLENEYYLGWRQPRLAGSEYDALVEEFVQAVRDEFPGALIQWEDFRKDNALTILDRYRQTLPSFNDDIQGTGAVAAAGVLTALRISGADLADQRIVIHGAGAAGLGIARQLRVSLADAGVNGEALSGAVALLDSRGLLAEDREIGDPYKRELAWSVERAASLGLPDGAPRDLQAVVGAYRPTVLIGASGQTAAFTETIVKAMAQHVDRPVILPFSNPTDLSEAVPDDLIRWTGGRALVATGSPFEPVEWNGQTIDIGQGNNVFIFPGVGLGALVAGAGEVTDGMIAAASRALVECVSDEELAAGLLFPAISRLREVSMQVAAAVAHRALEDGVADGLRSEQVQAAIVASSWYPQYEPYTPG